jgi:hypothetical protein
MTRDMMCALVDEIAGPPLSRLALIKHPSRNGVDGPLMVEYNIAAGTWRHCIWYTSVGGIVWVGPVKRGDTLIVADSNFYVIPTTEIMDCMYSIKQRLVMNGAKWEFKADSRSIFAPVGDDGVLCLRCCAFKSVDNNGFYGQLVNVFIDLTNKNMVLLNKIHVSGTAKCASLRDGRVLISGSRFQADGDHYATECMIFDPVRKWIDKVAPMNVLRWDHASCTLPNGRVFVCGGYTSKSMNQRSFLTNTCEEYDPDSGKWTLVGEMMWARCLHSCALLPDGRVMIIGGTDIGQCEFYDPVIGRSATAPTFARPMNHFSVMPIYE